MKVKSQSNALLYTLGVLIIVVVSLSAGYIAYSNSRSPENKGSAHRISVAPLSSADHLRGDLRAPVHIIVFSDPECPYCKKMHESILPALEMEFTDSIVIGYRHRLVPRYTRSAYEARAMECAGEIGGDKGFWRFADMLFRATPSEDTLEPSLLFEFANDAQLDRRAFSECLLSPRLDARIAEDEQEASIAHVTVSPTLVLMLRDGSQPLVIPGSSHTAVRTAVAFLLAFPQVRE